MKPNSHEQSKRHTFDSFCKKVLKHEARDYYDELKRQRDREVSFSDLSEKELAQLYTEDQSRCYAFINSGSNIRSSI